MSGATEIVAPTTEQLVARLRQLGLMVVPHGEYFGVRLSLFTSVRFSVRNGVLEMDARFGAVSRVRATVAKTLVVTLLAVFALSRPEQLEGGVITMFLSLALWGYDALRYTVTEACMTQIRHAFNSMISHAPAQVADAQMAALGAPPVLDPAAFAQPKAEVRR